uniref:Uncharacterized protein n=1 Tax=Chromera velia CCMP2878 TaxID=1169474 RepID=A0A0G4I7K0_9ALVE|eukprot:Cvel_11679.t1-p1 / transcript=Cvel_11679.t1 / gene=Cvel_11679 / organism=Chromera_velia_CCMP2878 / gene_product=Ankyrin repeat domain-containing protein 50, putative / transcript_product=Ankyrin repeat domain-containing protein 50, putative / location=Cvel_scaffold740:45932-47269(-) / protein_length=446 / sequence_SO=supercontig / SO=protein_coding / is_pseudo=false
MEATADSVILQLVALENLFFQALEAFRNKRKVLEKIKLRNRQAHSSSPSTESNPLPRETAALARLRTLVEVQFGDVKKSFHAELDQLTSCNYKMDLSDLFDSTDVGMVIRSFQPMSTETLLTALDTYTETGEKEDLRYLLFVRADIDGLVDGETPLIRAVKSDNLRAVIGLVRWGAGLEVKGQGENRLSGGTALHDACCRCDSDWEGAIVRFLLSRGANPNTENPGGYRPLHCAAARSFVDVFAPLLLYGAEVRARDSRGDTALHLAAFRGHREATQSLLNRGARVYERGWQSHLPLHYTACGTSAGVNDHREVAELLLSEGADVNARDARGRTVLHHAALWGSVDVAKFVLEWGADIHQTDDSGRTALHFTARLNAHMTQVGVVLHEKVRIAQMLVNWGIDVYALNDGEMTALACAERDLPVDSPIRVFLSTMPQQPSSQQQQQQ